MPMLGFGYLITMVGPDQATTPWGYTAFQIVRSVVLSTQVICICLVLFNNHISAQGLVISLPYCYLNSEVQTVVHSHYNRWQLIRTVGRGQSPSPSVTATMTYSSNNQVPSVRVMSCVLQCLFACWSMCEGAT